MLELQIYSPSEDGFVKTIEWNYEEIKKEVSEKMKDYSAIVYTEDQIKDAKSDRAALNKFLSALEGKRKEIKKLCLEPYEAFDKQMKEITSVVSESINSIDTQVKAYEENAKAEKKTAIVEYFNSLPSIEDFPSLELSRIWSEKWLNLSMPLKKVQEEISDIIEGIKDDLETLSSLPEYGFEASSIYRTTLDVHYSIREGENRYRMQKAKEEMQARQAERAAAEKAAAEEKEQVIIDVAPEDIEMPKEDHAKPIEEPKRDWVKFAAYLSAEDAFALRDFFNSRNILFKSI